MNNKINCNECKHYHITWDKLFPRGCRLFAFKTNKLPSDIVYSSTGSQCRNFERKEYKK